MLNARGVWEICDIQAISACISETVQAADMDTIEC